MKNLTQQPYQIPFKNILPFEVKKLNFTYIRFFYLDIRSFRNRIYYFPEYFCCKTIFIRQFHLYFQYISYKITNKLKFIL